MNAKIISSIVLIFFPAVSPSALPADDEVTLAQAAKATRVYLRDSAEFPLRMSVELTITDQAGHTRKHKTGEVNYDFHGYNPRAERARMELKGPRSLLKPASALFVSTYAPAAVLRSDAEENYTFTISKSGPPDVITADLAPIPKCDPFEWSSGAYPSVLCGSFEIQLQKNDLKLKHLTFNAAGLPISAVVNGLGTATILRYHSEIEFQEVFLPGDSMPFLIPGRATMTAETDKGKYVISFAYAPKKTS